MHVFRFSWASFTFLKPDILSREQYQVAKNRSLGRSTIIKHLWQSFKELLIANTSQFLAILLLVVSAAVFGNSRSSIGQIVLGITILIGAISCISIFMSLFSFVVFVVEHAWYWGSVNRVALACGSYDEFLKIARGRQLIPAQSQMVFTSGKSTPRLINVLLFFILCPVILGFLVLLKIIFKW